VSATDELDAVDEPEAGVADHFSESSPEIVTEPTDELDPVPVSTLLVVTLVVVVAAVAADTEVAARKPVRLSRLAALSAPVT
jgi:hypothetical protein